jgi:cytochrome c oxidase subunit 2
MFNHIRGFGKSHVCGDSPYSLQVIFQDPATDYMIGIITFNNHLLAFIISIVLFVGWVMISIISTHLEFNSSEIKAFYHNAALEIFWTIVPGIMLGSFFHSSISLLYSYTEDIETMVSIKILGYQWYWRYEISDKGHVDPEPVKFNTYHLVDELMCLDKSGILRNLEIDRRVLVPTLNKIKLSITGSDVLHSWTIPSFGIKVDACPGRVNRVYLFVKRPGLFFGQCSEICGTNHGFMPIVVLALPLEFFRSLLRIKVENITHMF